MEFSKTEQIIYDMAEPIAAAHGCYIYDVEYVKEGGAWYLRVFTDKPEGGIFIDECEVISREISEVLDKKDPVKENYFLEVASPGIERRLRQTEHFEKYMGKLVNVGLYKARNGSKTLHGKLTGFNDKMISIETETETVELPQKETTYVKLHFEF